MEIVKKIVSGGQTGADLAGLLFAREQNIPTGGWAAKGFLTETGPNPQLRDFGLEEFSEAGYPARTAANVRDSDGTLILHMGKMGNGCRLTHWECKKQSKPCMIVDVSIMKAWLAPEAEAVRKWLHQTPISTLNVAGTRGSHAPGIEARVMLFLSLVWGPSS